MAQKLMACNMYLIWGNGVLSQDCWLFIRCELNGVHSVRLKRIIKEDVLEALIIADVIVVWYVNPQETIVRCETNQVESGEIGRQERIFFHLTWPRQLRDDCLRVDNELLELTTFLLVHNSNPSRKVSTRVLWIYVCLTPTDIAFNDRALVFNPEPLAILVNGDWTRLEMLNILLKHLALIVIRSILQSFRQVEVNIFEVVRKLAEFDLESLALELKHAWNIHGNTRYGDDKLILTLLEESRIYYFETVYRVGF